MADPSKTVKSTRSIIACLMSGRIARFATCKRKGAIAILVFMITFTFWFWPCVSFWLHERYIYHRYHSEFVSFGFEHNPIVDSKSLPGCNVVRKNLSFHIDRVFIQNTCVSNRLLQDVSTLSDVTRLHFYNVTFDDQKLKAFQGMKRLKSIGFDKCELAPIAFDTIAEMRQLETINLYECEILGSWIEPLQLLPHLRALNLDASTMSADVISEINNLPQLRSLSLAKSNVNDSLLDGLSEESGITRLDLSDTAVTDRGVHSVVRLQQLCQVNAEGSKITERSYALLRSINNRCY